MLIVRCLYGHLDVVRVALLERRGGDPDEPALLLQLGDGLRADVEHRLRQSADELVGDARARALVGRSEEHTSELQSLMRISYAVFCLKQQQNIQCTS